MKKIKDISLKIDELIRVSNKEQRRIITTLKKDLFQTYNSLYYNANYNKNLALPNSNKLENDIKELEKTNVYLLFIYIPDLTEKAINEKEKSSILVFIDKLKELIAKNNFLKDKIYVYSNYLVLLSTKQTVNSNCLKIKLLKNNYESYKAFEIKHNKYKKISAKINKNIQICLENAKNN